MFHRATTSIYQTSKSKDTKKITKMMHLFSHMHNIQLFSFLLLILCLQSAVEFCLHFASHRIKQ